MRNWKSKAFWGTAAVIIAAQMSCMSALAEDDISKAPEVITEEAYADGVYDDSEGMVYLPDYFSFKLEDVRDISIGDRYEISLEAGIAAAFKFIPAKNGDYAFYSTLDDGVRDYADTYGCILDADFNEIYHNDDDNSNGQFIIHASLEEGKSYYLVARYYSSAAYTDDSDAGYDEDGCAYHKFYVNFTSADDNKMIGGYFTDFDDVTEIELDKVYDIELESNFAKIYQFTPEKSGKYILNNPVDYKMNGMLCDENFNALGEYCLEDDSNHTPDYLTYPSYSTDPTNPTYPDYANAAYAVSFGYDEYEYNPSYLYLEEDRTYYYVALSNSPYSWSSSLKISYIEAFIDGFMVTAIDEINVGDRLEISLEAGIAAAFKFVPEKDGIYAFFSSLDEGVTDYADSYGYILDSEFNIITYDDDSNYDSNYDSNQFRVYAGLEEGKTYYLAARYARGITYTDEALAEVTVGGSYVAPNARHKFYVNLVPANDDDMIGERFADFDDITEIKLDTLYDIEIKAANAKIYKFIPEKTGNYIFSNPVDSDIHGSLYDEDYNLLADYYHEKKKPAIPVIIPVNSVYDVYLVPDTDWQYNPRYIELEAGKTYYYAAYGENSHDYYTKLKVTYVDHVETIVNNYMVLEINDINVGDRYKVSLNGGCAAAYKFVPQKDGWYAFYGSLAEDVYYIDTKGYILDADFEEIGYNDDDNTCGQFFAKAELQAGETYYLVAMYFNRETFTNENYAEENSGVPPFYVNLDCADKNVVFEDYLFVDYNDVTEMKLNTSYEYELKSNHGKIYSFTPEESGNYMFDAVDYEKIVNGYLCDKDYNILVELGAYHSPVPMEAVPNEEYDRVAPYLEKGTTYYFVATPSMQAHDDCSSVIVKKVVKISDGIYADLAEIEDIRVNDKKDVNTKVNSVKLYRFVPIKSGYYAFYAMSELEKLEPIYMEAESDNEGFDLGLYGLILDEDYNSVISDSILADELFDFYNVVYLQAGKTYYLGAYKIFSFVPYLETTLYLAENNGPEVEDGNSWGEVTPGWEKVSETGKWYYYTEDGMVYSDWAKVDGKWYYFGETGAMVTGWAKVDGKWYYFDASGAMATGLKTIDGQKYYFNAGGDLATGFKKIDGKWYLFKQDGSMAVGFGKADGLWYYFDENGQMMTGWVKDNGQWYYFGADGAMKTGLVTIGSEKYFFKAGGEMLIGWQKIDGKWYLFKGDGAMAVNGFGKADGYWYYFDENGAMVTGWVKDAGTWYYFGAGGEMKTGWITLNGVTFYLKQSGAMACSETLKIDGASYTFNASGALVK